jgi:DNA-binding LacI/PurR family transcriptional regulator
MDLGNITSVNVAQYAQVSQSTVSRVLNKKGNVKEETKEKVMAAVEALGYQPNAMARCLTSRKTNIIAVVSVDSTRSFFVKIINMVSQRLSLAGKHILYFQVRFDEEMEEIFNQICQYQVDGLISLSAAISPKISETCERIGLPVAVFNRQIPSARICSIRSNNIDASAMVADCLIDKGYKTFGFIGSTNRPDISFERQKGFTDCLYTRGFFDLAVEYGDFSYDSGREAIQRMAAKNKPLPRAVFFANDLMAMGAMDTLRYEMGLSVPQDIGIIGFDAIEEGAWKAYNLTTVEQSISLMIETLCDYLLMRIEDDMIEAKAQLFSCTILERGST